MINVAKKTSIGALVFAVLLLSACERETYDVRMRVYGERLERTLTCYTEKQIREGDRAGQWIRAFLEVNNPACMSSSTRAASD